MIESIVATMIESIVTRARTLLMSLKFLMMMLCGFVGRGMNGECDQVKRREASELEEFSWLDLPTDVVELILSYLGFEDEAKLACVCKSWMNIIYDKKYVYPVGKIPLLIRVRTRGEGGGKGAIFHYHSPWLNEAFQFRFPLDLRGYEIISAKDGTLLIYNQDEMQMRMVNPLNGYSIDFPSITSNISFNGTAIGLHDNCYIIFLIDTSHENQVTVHLYEEGPDWALNLEYDNNNEPFYLSSNPVYLDGRFYCLGSKGDRLGVFDLLERTWNLYSVKFRNKYDDDDIRCCRYYLVEWIDTVMAVRVNNRGSGIRLFLLDRKRMVWKETNDLRGRSLFLGSTLSVTSLPTAKRLQNRVFLPHCHKDEPKRVVVVEPFYWADRFYLMEQDSIPRKEMIQAVTTICCCNNGGEESQYLGSTQNKKYCSIWYQPFYNGLIDD